MVDMKMGKISQEAFGQVKAAPQYSKQNNAKGTR